MAPGRTTGHVPGATSAPLTPGRIAHGPDARCWRPRAGTAVARSRRPLARRRAGVSDRARTLGRGADEGSPDVHQGHRADPPGEVPELPPPESRRSLRPG